MTNRITISTLEAAVARLNRVAATDDYTLDATAAGYRLCQGHRIGGERDLTDRASARETYNVINAYISGYEDALLERAIDEVAAFAAG